MLDSMRRSGASIFIYLIFGILIAIFVINIGPGSGKRGDEGGCTGTSNSVVTVDGSDANAIAFGIAYSSPTNRGQGKERVYSALEALIRREMLASEGTDRGLRVTDDLVDEGIKQGYFYLGGQKISIKDQVFDEHDDGSKTWNIKRFKAWVSGLNNVSLGAYRSEQTRSMQAAMMAEILRSTVRVSREEAAAEFQYDNHTVEYDVVPFSATAFRDAMRLTDADLTRFVSEHEADVKKKYTDNERLYKATKPELHLRQIFIAKAEEAKPDDKKPDDKKPDDKKPDDKKKPAGMSVEAAKAKLEAARTAIAGNKQKFADAAKELATEEADKANGGDLGWRKVDGPQLGDKALNDAAKALKPGEMTPVITTDRGAFIVMADDKREGDLSFDQVKNELAADLAKDTWSKEAAKRAAIKALDTAKTEKKDLAKMFESDLQMPSHPPGKTGPPMKITPEQMEQIKKQLEQQGVKHGSTVTYESVDQLAGWNAGPDGSSTGSAGSAAAGSGSGSTALGTPATPATPAMPAEVVASKDQLPTFGDMPAVKYSHHGPEKRVAQLPGLEGAKEAVGILFDELADGQLAPRVLEGDTGAYYVVQLTKKVNPETTDFDKKAEELMQRLQDARSGSMLLDWMRTKCETLAKAGKIKVAPDKTRDTDDQGKPLPVTYQPCYQLRAR